MLVCGTRHLNGIVLKRYGFVITGFWSESSVGEGCGGGSIFLERILFLE